MTLILRLCGLLALFAMFSGLSGCEQQRERPTSYPPAVEERVALVIGNAGYRNFTSLPGSRADAELVADALRSQGFTLIGGGPHFNLNWAETVQLMRVFEGAMHEGGVAVFYHSGHAAQVAGENYIVPVDAGAWSPDAVDTELVRIAGSFRPPAGREPRIKLIMLDRTLPGPLLGGPTPVIDVALAEETLEPNEIQIFASGPDSRVRAAEEILGTADYHDSGELDQMSASEPSIMAQAFADALRTPYTHIVQVAYQLNVLVADYSDDHQHLMTRFGEAIPDAGPLVGAQGSRSLLSRLDEAERGVLVRRQDDVRPIRSQISELIGGETRSIQAVSDTVATLTVLNIEAAFPLSRSGRSFVADDGSELARLEAWRRVLNESRAARLQDWQKAAVLSVTSSTSSNRLHAAGIDTMLESGEFEDLPDAIESLARDVSSLTPTARISLERRRTIERALFELPEAGRGAGALINAFPSMADVDEPEPGVQLNSALNRARSAVADCAPDPLNANQMEALASFALSISVEAFRSSSICRRLGDRAEIEVARELAYSSFEVVDGAIVHDDALARRRAYETALFLAVNEGAARDRLHEVRLARSLQSRGIEVAANASVAELQEAARPQVETVAAPVQQVQAAFRTGDGLRNAAYFIRMFEGLELDAYQDIVGVWTIGFGTTGEEIGPGMHISEEQATRYLLDYISQDWRALAPSVEVELAAHEQAAILSLSYNVGRGNVSRSTLLRELNSGDRQAAADQFLVWNRARIGGELTVVRGLDRRRHTERALFQLDAEPEIAQALLMQHMPFRPQAEPVSETQSIIGYGRIGAGQDFPRRIDEEDAAAWLAEDLDRIRAQITNRLTQTIEPVQIEALTLVAYAVGMERFERKPILTYINEGNTQAALQAIGYWRDEQLGRDGEPLPLENWEELRAAAAALYTMGFRS